MIQRIQSVWLFLAAMIAGLLFISKLYAVRIGVLTAAVEVHYGVRDSGHLALYIMAAVMTALPMITIFFFGDRKRQKGFVWLSIIANLAFMGLTIMKIANVKAGTGAVGVTYDFGLLLPVIGIVFLALAMRGINKDEKLIRSMDRLR